MAAYGVIVLLRVPETRPAVAATAVRSAGLRDVVTDRVFMTFVGLIFLVTMVQWQSSVSLSAYMATQGHSAAEYGAVLAVNGILIVLLQPSLLQVLARFDRSRTLAGAALLTGLGFFVHGLVATLPLHVVAVMIWTVGEIAASPAGSETVAGLAPIETRGRYQGVYAMSFGLSACIGPFVGSHLLAAAGSTGLWGACLGLTIVAALGVLATAPGRRARMSISSNLRP
jgi:MFS family permease